MIAQALALAISFLLLVVASGDLAHAVADADAHSPGPALLEPAAPPVAPGSGPPHDAPECPTCRAARSANVLLGACATFTTTAAGVSLTVSLPEAPAPAAPRRHTGPARAPPARLVV